MKGGREVVAIIGAGRLARAMTLALSPRGGVRVLVAARRPKAAAALAREAKGARSASVERALAEADVVLLAVPDRSIATLAAALAPLRKSWRGVVVLHGAGAYGPELLSALGSQGAATDIFHPLAVLSSRGASTLQGAFVRIEGTGRAVRASLRLAKLCGLTPLGGSGLTTPAGRRAYHAAASLASNDVLALVEAAHRVLVRHGVPKRRAWQAILSLASGTLAAAAHGAAAALTGPVVRNDAGTLELQLAALASKDPEARDAHVALSAVLVSLAVRSGRLGHAEAASLKRRLVRGRSLRQRV